MGSPISDPTKNRGPINIFCSLKLLKRSAPTQNTTSTCQLTAAGDYSRVGISLYHTTPSPAPIQTQVHIQTHSLRSKATGHF